MTLDVAKADIDVVNLIRLRRSDHGSEGIMVFQHFCCFTMELPWRDNLRSLSCIPPGAYLCELRLSPHFGRVYWLTNVPNRQYILIHSGNWGGDVQKGLKSHTNGCILLGKYQGYLQGQRAVLCSRPTVTNLLNHLQGRPFLLNIKEMMT